jgi:hypothetical protein
MSNLTEKEKKELEVLDNENIQFHSPVTAFWAKGSYDKKRKKEWNI